MWGFLSEFWNSITSVADYPIEFFQNIGKAVAGAIGNFFDFLLHLVNDLPIFISWVFNNLWSLFSSILQFFNFIFTFISKFFDTAFSSSGNYSTIWSIPDEIIDVFKSVPYWSYLGTALGIAILIVLGLSIFRKLEHL